MIHCNVLVIIIVMALKLVRQTQTLFSIFKKKIAPIQTTDYKSPEDLFHTLSTFESQLTHL